ncbi:MAG: multidrug efflux SMR transporter [Dehalococcoidia bacterium]|nr:multidrug efflux SMR transporter [Dehalococcoidia bacterium]
MYWIVLVVAGLLETAWAFGLKHSGPAHPWITFGTLVAIVGSMALLALVMQHLPTSTAYVVWVGIGAVGTVILGVTVLGEPVTALRIGSVLAILGGVFGLTRV